jgi:hypothetical protein
MRNLMTPTTRTTSNFRSLNQTRLRYFTRLGYVPRREPETGAPLPTEAELAEFYRDAPPAEPTPSIPDDDLPF